MVYELLVIFGEVQSPNLIAPLPSETTFDPAVSFIIIYKGDVWLFILQGQSLVQKYW